VTDLRVPLLSTDDAQAAAATVGVSSVAADLNIFRAWLHVPPLAGWMHELIMGLLWHGNLDTRLRELVIMRLGWTTGSEYEWAQHWRIATEFLSVDGEDLLAVRNWRTSDRFGDAEQAILAATDDVVAHGYIREEAWSACTAALGDDPAVMTEVSAVIAVWRMVSTCLRSMEVPLEDGVAPWPPAGEGPASASANGGSA
jgi:alkylhydroperoxidase family enzyme